MTRKIKTFGILFLLIVGQTACGQKGEEKLVVKAFENYKTAILNDKGEDAVKFVDSISDIQPYSCALNFTVAHLFIFPTLRLIWKTEKMLMLHVLVNI